MTKRDTVALVQGASSTGTPHGLLIEHDANNSLRFTVVGHDGKKRHAAVILTAGQAAVVKEALIHVL